MSDVLFHRVEGAQIILHKKGVYMQAALYRRGDRVFARAAGGYIGVSARGGTTLPDVNWLDMDFALDDAVICYDALGRAYITTTARVYVTDGNQP